MSDSNSCGCVPPAVSHSRGSSYLSQLYGINSGGPCSTSTSVSAPSPDLLLCGSYPGKDHKNGKQAMSLCLAFSTFGALYFAVDSRSSVGVGGTTVDDYYLSYWIKSDDYLKIAYIKILDKNVVLYSTGANCFKGNKTFTECLSEISLDSIVNVEDGVEKICAYFSKQMVSDLYISFFYFTDAQQYVYCDYNNRDGRCEFSNYCLPRGREGVRRFHSGADWGQALAKRMIFYNDFNDEMAVCAFNQLYTKIQQVSPFFDDTIGGTIRIAKLTPDGFTWLQGEPT